MTYHLSTICYDITSHNTIENTIATRHSGKMVCHKQICAEIRAYIKLNCKDSVKDLMNATGVSRKQIYRIKGEALGEKSSPPCRKGVGGRPPKLTTYDVRRIVREVIRLRGIFPNWTAKQLMAETGISNVHVRTVRRVLNRCGYHYLQTIKKGLMTAKDRRGRVKIGKTILKNYSSDVWIKDVAFYFDGVNFVFKRNPKGHALCPRGRVWRRRNEGLDPGCIAKGRKEVVAVVVIVVVVLPIIFL